MATHKTQGGAAMPVAPIVNSEPVSLANPLPVTTTNPAAAFTGLTDAQLRATPVPTVPVPLATAVGWDEYRNIDLDETGVLVKGASVGILNGYYIANLSQATRYVKIYDHTDAPVAADTPNLTIPIPGGSAANLSNLGWNFVNGLGVRATTGVADADTGAPSGNDVVVNLFYK